MKKHFISLLLMLVFLLSLAVHAGAATVDVYDWAELLTERERSKLEEHAQEISDEYDIDVIILTVDTLDGKSSNSYAEDFYDDNGYGDDGVLLLVSMEDRDWCILLNGEADGIVEYDILEEALLEDLSAGNYYDAFDGYLSALEECFDDPGAGTSGRKSGVNILISIVIGLVAAAVAILIMRSGMNTAKARSGAAEYIKAGSYHLTQRQDIFLYSRVSKTAKPQNNGSSRSGGGSRSRSTRSGKF